MTRGLILMLVALIAVSGCNKGAKSDADIVVRKAGDAPKTEAKAQANRPANITLASGEIVKVIGVPDLDKDPAQYNGSIAIAGKVETVFADRGAFTLVDAEKMAGCSDACCSPTTVPLNVPSLEYQGELPGEGDQVIVIGKLTAEETGFSFDVLEVRKDNAPIIARKAEVPAAQT